MKVVVMAVTAVARTRTRAVATTTTTATTASKRTHTARKEKGGDVRDLLVEAAKRKKRKRTPINQKNP
jgi:hypothetical protein